MVIMRSSNTGQSHILAYLRNFDYLNRSGVVSQFEWEEKRTGRRDPDNFPPKQVAVREPSAPPREVASPVHAFLAKAGSRSRRPGY